MKKKEYKHCICENDEGTISLLWIPVEKAKINEVVDFDGDYIKGRFRIIRVFSVIIDEEHLHSILGDKKVEEC